MKAIDVIVSQAVSVRLCIHIYKKEPGMGFQWQVSIWPNRPVGGPSIELVSGAHLIVRDDK